MWHYKRDMVTILIKNLHEHEQLSEPEYEIKLLRASSPILQQDNTKF